MSERKKGKKTSAHTAMPLQAAPPLQKDDPVERLLQVLYDLAVNGNVSAAKLYLDYRHARGEGPGLTTEDALRLLTENLKPGPTS